MNLIKIGEFIAECRKEAKLTQMQLAEMLGITDRAVSKWENGRALPDSSIMLELCRILNISVNDLLRGERVSMENNNKELENKIIELIKEKEKADKRLLRIEVVMGICCVLPLIASVIIASTIPMPEWQATLIVLSSLIPLLIATPFAIKIEQKVGYYECQGCKNKYVPKYSRVFFAPHINRRRYMRCPECNKRTWHNKLISKD